MSKINARVQHETVEPRLESEKTVEVVTIESTDNIEIRFTRVGECIDVWEFQELFVHGDDRYTDPDVALTSTAAQAVLKKTPCVSIRDSNNDTLAEIATEPLQYQTSFYSISTN